MRTMIVPTTTLRYELCSALIVRNVVFSFLYGNHSPPMCQVRGDEVISGHLMVNAARLCDYPEILVEMLDESSTNFTQV